MKGLIIDEPWISKILKGEKTWEMRSTSTSTRGMVALIRKGSGAVVGVANVIGSQGPLGLDELRTHAKKHHVPMDEFESGRAMKWTVAWELTEAKALERGVRYRHPAGAVIWVNLDPEVEEAVRKQLHGGTLELPVENPTPKPPAGFIHAPAIVRDPSLEVPVARDGTWFGPHLSKSGYYTIGEKGDEQRVDNLLEAIRRLRSMQVPRWRRPNSQDNWGIVSGIRWERLSQLAR